MQAAKQDALHTINQLPENANMEEIMYQLYVLSYSQIWCMANQAASCSTLIPSLNFTPSMTSANRL